MKRRFFKMFAKSADITWQVTMSAWKGVITEISYRVRKNNYL